MAALPAVRKPSTIARGRRSASESGRRCPRRSPPGRRPARAVVPPPAGPPKGGRRPRGARGGAMGGAAARGRSRSTVGPPRRVRRGPGPGVCVLGDLARYCPLSGACESARRSPRLGVAPANAEPIIGSIVTDRISARICVPALTRSPHHHAHDHATEKSWGIVRPQNTEFTRGSGRSLGRRGAGGLYRLAVYTAYTTCSVINLSLYPVSLRWRRARAHRPPRGRGLKTRHAHGQACHNMARMARMAGSMNMDGRHGCRVRPRAR